MVKPDTVAIITMAMAGLVLTVSVLEVRDAKMLAESYRESALQATSLTETCLENLEDSLKSSQYAQDRTLLL